jgi:acid phosphatase
VSTGLVYSNSHGVGHPSELNSVAIYSGSTQDVDDNGRHHLFDGPNLAKALFDAGLSFGGYVENLPEDGSQVAEAGDGVYPDLYTRNLNPMAQFTDIGIDPATGLPRDNSVVNRTFGVFSSIPTGDYSSLPTVSFIIPNTLHSSHGSNEMEPWAGSPDEENNDILRSAADNWLKNNMTPTSSGRSKTTAC